MSNIKTYIKVKSIITNVIALIKNRNNVETRNIIAIENNKIIVTSNNKIISLGE